MRYSIREQHSEMAQKVGRTFGPEKVINYYAFNEMNFCMRLIIHNSITSDLYTGPESFSGRHGGSIYRSGTTLINYGNSIKIDRRIGA